MLFLFRGRNGPLVRAIAGAVLLGTGIATHGGAIFAAYGQHSSVGKILEIHQELPGRIHIVLIRQVVGF